MQSLKLTNYKIKRTHLSEIRFVLCLIVLSGWIYICSHASTNASVNSFKKTAKAKEVVALLCARVCAYVRVCNEAPAPLRRVISL